MTERHRVLSVSALGAALLTGSCGSGAVTDGSPVEKSSSVPSTVHTRSGVPFTAFTHCGVESIRIDGRWWHAKPPLYNQARNGPPEDWGDPQQDGVLTVESADRAVFVALGQQVVFVPAPDNEPGRPCD